MTTLTPLHSLKVGDIIRDDIMCRVTAINAYSFGDYTIHVEDGNGYRYMLRTNDSARITVWDWTEEDWNAYRAL